jgi:hypothetical protein
VIDGNGLQAQAATALVRALPAQAGTAGRKTAGSSPAHKDAAAKPAILGVAVLKSVAPPFRQREPTPVVKN